MGGDGLGVMATAALLTEAGRRAATVPALATLMLGVLPVVRWGDRDLHQVVLAGPHERLVLSHIAEDRSIFARGAIAAAQWGQGKKPGLYAMADVLGLSD